MAQHNESKGADLHEPSNARILNSTNAELKTGTWVLLGADENAAGFIPVTMVAGASDRRVGLVEDVNIATNNTGVVRVFGRVRANTASFSVNDQLRLLTSTTYALATDHTHTIGTVVTSAANGTIEVDTITLTVAGGTGGATALNGLSDVTIVSRQEGQILKVNASGDFVNDDEATATTVDGTAKQIIANTSGTTTTLSSALGDVVLTNVADKDVLEYNSTTSQFENKALANGLVEDLNDLSDVTITNPQPGQILKREGNVFINTSETPQTAVVGTAKQIITNVSGNTVTLSSALGNVNIAGVKNQDVLEYDAANSEFVVKTLPSGLAERLEDLEDVEIIGDADDKILVARGKAAYFQVNPTSIGDTIYSIDTSDGLMFTKPGGSTPLINSVSVAFATSRSGNTTSYLIVDETGGDQLLVELSFTASSITIEQFIDRIVLALQTDWADGTGTSIERTVNDQMSGNVLVGMNGTWSKAENPNFVRGEKAVGTTSDFSMPEGHPPINDAQAISWNISGRPNGYLEGITAAFTGLGDMPTVVELLDAGVSGLNAHSNFNPHYIASRVGNGIRVTALADGSQDNGRLVVEFIDNAMGPSNASGYISNEGNTNLTGGINGVGQEFAFRWTDSAHKHTIARPTLETGGSGTSTFRQGGFAWIDELPTLDLLSDVNINLPNPGSQQLQMLRSDFSGNFQNINARIENLNVSNISASLKQGTLLQYAPAGVGEWIHTGLRDDGSGNFTETPNQGQFLVFFDTGGTSSGWEAKDAGINDLSDITGTKETGAVLVLDTADNAGAGGYRYVNVPAGTCFAEIGNRSIDIPAGGGLSNQKIVKLPLENFDFDPTLYVVDGEEIDILIPGIYRVAAGLTKGIENTTAGTITALNFNLKVLQNDAIIAHDGYYSGFLDDFMLTTTLNLNPNQTVQAALFRDAMIVNVAANDKIRIEYEYSVAGLEGLTMGNGVFGKSWLRLERIG